MVHCIYGEDEEDKLCFERFSFREDATIECIENRPGYYFTIMAIPCDGFQDCRNGIDEECKFNNSFFVIGLFCFHIVTFCIWYYLTLGVKRNVHVKEPTPGEKGIFKDIEGDDLAELKVNILINKQTLI